MTHDDKDVHALERALTEAYRSQGTQSPGEIDVTQAVMQDIRRSAGDGNRWMPAVVLDQLVWRMATVAAAVALVATVVTAGMVLTTPGESTWLLAEELETDPLFGD
jgi:hypothetical protein